MLYLTLHILCILCFFQIMRLVQGRGEPLLPLVSINYLVAAVFGAVAALVAGASLSSVSPAIICAGTIVGIFYIVHLMIMFACIRHVGVGIAATVASVSAVSPVLFAALVWEESLTTWQIAALILLPVTLYLCRAAHSESDDLVPAAASPVVVNLLLAANFIIASAISTVHDMVDRIQPDAQTPYIFYLFLSAGLASVIVVFVKSRRYTRASLSYGAVLGICNGMATLFSLLALMQLKSVLMFPVAASAIILGSALLAFLIWGEQLIRRQLYGLAGALLVIVLIHLHGLLQL